MPAKASFCRAFTLAVGVVASTPVLVAARQPVDAKTSSPYFRLVAAFGRSMMARPFKSRARTDFEQRLTAIESSNHMGLALAKLRTTVSLTAVKEMTAAAMASGMFWLDPGRPMAIESNARHKGLLAAYTALQSEAPKSDEAREFLASLAPKTKKYFDAQLELYRAREAVSAEGKMVRRTQRSLGDLQLALDHARTSLRQP